MLPPPPNPPTPAAGLKLDLSRVFPRRLSIPRRCTPSRTQNTTGEQQHSNGQGNGNTWNGNCHDFFLLVSSCCFLLLPPITVCYIFTWPLFYLSLFFVFFFLSLHYVYFHRLLIRLTVNSQTLSSGETCKYDTKGSFKEFSQSKCRDKIKRYMRLEVDFLLLVQFFLLYSFPLLNTWQTATLYFKYS